MICNAQVVLCSGDLLCEGAMTCRSPILCSGAVELWYEVLRCVMRCAAVWCVVWCYDIWCYGKCCFVMFGYPVAVPWCEADKTITRLLRELMASWKLL